MRKNENAGSILRENVNFFVLLAAVIILLFGSVHVTRADEDNIPDSLLEFAEKYPEASDYVQAYPEKKDLIFDMSIQDEVQKGTIPMFLQWDERWGYHFYGSEFLGVAGCGPTCISMVLCGLTGDTAWNPYKVAMFAQREGYYVPDDGTSWDLMTEGAEKLGLNASYGDVSEEFIQENLTAGNPMICSVYPGEFTYTGHFIVLAGLEEDGRIKVNDPNSKINSEKKWSMDEILPQIRSIWVYTE